MKYFGLDKTRKLLAEKYYGLMIHTDLKTYIKWCDICLTSKVVEEKLYGACQSLPIPIHQSKDLSIDFITRLAVSIN